MGLGSFFGTYTPRMDDKGRVTLPARYREDFSLGVMVSRGQDRCLYVFTPDGFAEHTKGVVDAPLTDQRARGFQRYLLANSDQQTLDGQGRITVPARMREYAGLVRDVVVLGVGHRLELWDAQTWADYEAAQEADYIDPAAELPVV
jgi:MraZ protein